MPADKAALTAAHSFHTNHHPTLSVFSVSIRGSKLKRSQQSSGGRGHRQAANLYRLRWNFALPVIPGYPCHPCPSVVPKPNAANNLREGAAPAKPQICIGSDGTSPSPSFQAIRVFRVHPWFKTQTQQTKFGWARLPPSRKSVSAQMELRPPRRSRPSVFSVSIRGSKNQAFHQTRLGRNLTHPTQIASPGWR